MRFCIAIVLLAWPTLALFSKKKKPALGTVSPSDRIEFDKLNEQLRSMESKVGYVGDDIHKVVDRMDAVREGVQGVDWVMGTMMESLSKLGQDISQLQAESIVSKKDFGVEAQRLRESIEKDQGKFSSELNQKLDGMSRNIESLSESVARVHHLLALGSVMNAKATVAFPAPGGPPPPPPPPFNMPPPPPPSSTPNKSREAPKPTDGATSGGFGAVLDQLRSDSPHKRLKKSGSKFSVPQTDPSGSSTDDGRHTDSD